MIIIMINNIHNVLYYKQSIQSDNLYSVQKNKKKKNPLKLI